MPCQAPPQSAAQGNTFSQDIAENKTSRNSREHRYVQQPLTHSVSEIVAIQCLDDLLDVNGCDETKPRCRRCLENGARCPGYRPPQPRMKVRFLVQTAQPTDHNDLQPALQGQPTHRQLRWRQQSLPFPSLTLANHGHLHRTQLLSTFVTLYLPARSSPTLTAPYTYISLLPSLDLSSSLMQLSVDTLCLLEIGSQYEDEMLLRESQAKYVRALHMLAFELTKPKERRLKQEFLLAVIAVLGLCELYDMVGESGEWGNPGRGWLSHVDGAVKFIENTGPEILSSSLGRLLYQNIRHQAGCLALARRHPIIFGEGRWLSITREAALEDPAVALYDILVQVPNLLSGADAYIYSKDQSDEAYHGLMNQGAALSDLLNSWETSWATDPPPYSIVNMGTFRAFTSLVPDSTTFHTVFDFPSAQQCLHMQLYWLCQTLVSKVLLEITHHTALNPTASCANVNATVSPASIQDIERTLYVSSTSLCRTIPFCAHPSIASVGRIGTFMIGTVQRYLGEKGHCAEYEWCRDVRGVFAAPKMSRCDRISSIGHGVEEWVGAKGT